MLKVLVPYRLLITLLANTPAGKEPPVPTNNIEFNLLKSIFFN